MTEQEQLANLAYGAWALATKEDGPAFVREAIEQAYKLGQDAAREEEREACEQACRSITWNLSHSGNDSAAFGASECELALRSRKGERTT